ncbi:cytochrome P450 CYP82D47-like [Mangifera indica]|uniref:cytochrome P450 CYP82D47-like n=1 Tax=Mangifera indica TaxID=29780 RepID=UPI001CF97041|nr:cytochrome P450 CYP82D47-like [Mangifera indica]
MQSYQQSAQSIMDPSIQFLLSLLFSLLALSICIYYLYQSKKLVIPKTTTSGVPEVGDAWPIIGHMHLFGGRKLIYRTLSDMADKYGPVFTIRLGSNKALVVSNWEMIKECCTVYDKVFCGKPAITASKLLCFDYAMFSFAPYGPYWREMRKVTTVELLSNHRLDKLKHIKASEVQTSIKELYKAYMSRSSTENGVLVEMKQWFKDLTCNVTLRMVVGRRFSGSGDDEEKGKARHCQKLFSNFFSLFGVFVLADAIPSLGWLDFGGYKKAMKKTAEEMDVLAGEWLEEHKQRRKLGGEAKEDQDFMDVMLTLQEDTKISGFDADTISKATCLNLIVASDTNMVLLTWAFTLLLNHPHVLKKAQEELDIHVGKARHVEESDIKNLVYLQAIVKETLRLYPPGPVIPRSANTDCTLSNGFHVAAGTRVMLNVWKIQHDERVWPNPNEFHPERFLTDNKDTEVRGLNFELIPFGCGRRACAGISLALQVVHLTLASLLQCFEVMKPSNVAVDMTESPGMTNIKATPLEVLLIPRLDPKLYTQ